MKIARSAPLLAAVLLAGACHRGGTAPGTASTAAALAPAPAAAGPSLYTRLGGVDAIRAVAGMDTFVAYAPLLEDHILPQVADVAAAIRELAAF